MSEWTSETRPHVVRSSGGHVELLPNEGTDGSDRSRQRQRQSFTVTRPGYPDVNYLLLKAQRLAANKTEFLVLRKAA